MKIQRLMLAVLAVCGTSAAMAQSTVNLYGRVNTTVENWKVGSNKAVTGLRDNTSFIGFRGTEDLGNGLKAGFQLESAFNADNGSGYGATGGLDFGRHSEVNLSGGFGTLRLGTFNAASYLATADFISMHNHDTGLSADALYAYTMRETNKIAYVTPVFGGFSAEVQHSFHEKAAGTGNKNAWDMAVNYNNGPLGLGLGYSQSPTELTVGGTDYFTTKGQQLTGRVSYAIGSLTLGAYYQHFKMKGATDGTSDPVNAKRNAYRLAAMYTLGASEFHANVGRADKVKVAGGSVTGSAATQWTLGYNYNLSKRTKVYGYYTKISNGAAASYGSLDKNAGENQRSVAVGIRHLF